MTALSQARVLVTGSSGFIGTNLVESLIGECEAVLALDCCPPKVQTHASIYRQADLLNKRQLVNAINEFRPHHIVHLGARTDLDGSDVRDYVANHEGTRNLMEASCVAEVERVIFASSRLVNRINYTPTSDTDYCPSTPYGESKVIGEQIIRGASTIPYEWCIVRPTSIWGPWFAVPYRNFFDAILAGRYVHPAGFRITKSFGYVGNAIYQLKQLLDAKRSDFHRQTFYLADYEPIEVLSFAEEISRQSECHDIRQVPFAFLRLGALCGDYLKKFGMRNPPLTSFRLSNLTTPMLYDTLNLQRLTGDLPYTHERGIAATLKWLKERDSVNSASSVLSGLRQHRTGSDS